MSLCVGVTVSPAKAVERWPDQTALQFVMQFVVEALSEA